MSMNEQRSTHIAEDWGVVLQSVPSKNKREIVKRLEEIFEVEKRDAEQILANMPLILVDNVSFGLAARIKKFFQTLGAVAETTNHDMIKKNCFQIVWPQVPDLSFFMKNEASSAEPPAQDKQDKQDKKGKLKSGIFPFPEKKKEAAGPESEPEMPRMPEPPNSVTPEIPSRDQEKTKSGGFPFFEKKKFAPEPAPEMPKTQELPSPVPPAQEPPPVLPKSKLLFGDLSGDAPQENAQPGPVFGKPAAEPVKPVQRMMPIEEPAKPVERIMPVEEPAKPAERIPPVVPLQPIYELKSDDAPEAEVDTEWEKRAKELNEKLRKFHEEKQELHTQHNEVIEKTKNEYQQKLEEEMRTKAEYQQKLEEEKRAKAEYQRKLEEEIKAKAEYQQKLEEERKKNEEIAKRAQEILQKEAEKQSSLTRDGEEWRSRAESLGGKVNELETHLVQKATTVEQIMQQIEEEKKKNEEASRKSAEALQKEAERRESLAKEGEEWRSKAAALDAKVRELETNLVQKTTTVEQMAQQVEAERRKIGESAKAYEDLQQELRRHEAMVREGEEWKAKASALNEKVHELETHLTHKTSAVEQLIQQKEDITQKSERVVSETQREISTLRGREEELSRKVEALEGDLREMTESLKFRDNALAQFEKQIMELAEKTQDYETLRHEHTQMARERGTIRQEYDAKLADQEVRLAKYEEEHRRYRSRMDRKNAAAARELGEWVRGIDNVRQGLQKLILFLGSESAVLESEKKSNLKSPLTRGPDFPMGDDD